MFLVYLCLNNTTKNISLEQRKCIQHPRMSGALNLSNTNTSYTTRDFHFFTIVPLYGQVVGPERTPAGVKRRSLLVET